MGLSPKDLSIVQNILKSCALDPKTVRVFGSRAMGTYQAASDLDLVVYGEVSPQTPYIPTFYVGTNRLTIISRMTEVNRRIDALKRLKILKEDLDEGKSFFLDGELYCL